MNFRFRKSMTLIPGLLKFTVSKSGVSLNFHAGVFSRSWGTRGTTTTVDMPGTSGMFWRGSKSRRKPSEQERELDAAKAWRFRGTTILVAQAAVGLVRIHAPWSHVHGSWPHIALAALIGGQALAWSATRRGPLPAFGLLLGSVGAFWLFGRLV